MVRYEVTCDHEHCHFNQEVILNESVSDWHPPKNTGVLDKNGEPIIEAWGGQPLEDAYCKHYEEIHAAEGKPPMCSWRITE